MMYTVTHDAQEPSVDLRNGFVCRHSHLSTISIATGNLDKYALKEQLQKLLKCRETLQEKKAVSNSESHAVIDDQINNDNQLIKKITEKCMELFDRTD